MTGYTTVNGENRGFKMRLRTVAIAMALLVLRRRLMRRPRGRPGRPAC